MTTVEKLDFGPQVVERAVVEKAIEKGEAFLLAYDPYDALSIEQIILATTKEDAMACAFRKEYVIEAEKDDREEISVHFHISSLKDTEDIPEKFPQQFYGEHLFLGTADLR